MIVIKNGHGSIMEFEAKINDNFNEYNDYNNNYYDGCMMIDKLCH